MILMILICLCAAIAFGCLYVILIDAYTEGRKRVNDRVSGLGYESGANKKKKHLSLKINNPSKKEKSVFARTRKEFVQLEDDLYNAGIKTTVQTFLALWIAVTIGGPMLLLMSGVGNTACIIFALVSAFLPFLYIRHKKNKRRKILEKQLIDGINIMCSALRAGHSFQTAMHNIALDMEGPIAEEFGRVFRETQRGMNIDESFNSLVDRVGSSDLDMLCQAILIQRRVGGNLAEVLEKISETIKKRLDLKEEIGVLTSSGRISGYIVGGLPIVIIAIVSLVNPEYTNVLFYSGAGHKMLIISGLLEMTGFILINKIVDIKY